MPDHDLWDLQHDLDEPDHEKRTEEVRHVRKVPEAMKHIRHADAAATCDREIHLLHPQ